MRTRHMLYCSCVWSGNCEDDDDDDDGVTDSVTFSYISPFHLPLGSFFMCQLNSINIYSFNSSFMLCHEVLQRRVLSLVEEWRSFLSRLTLHIFIFLGTKSARSWSCYEMWGAASAKTTCNDSNIFRPQPGLAPSSWDLLTSR